MLSERPRLLFDYFTQQFAQVTNPPLDSIREEVVTSLALGLGPERNLLSWGADHARSVTLDFPVIDNDELAKIQHIDTALPGRSSVTIRGLYRVEAGHKGMQKRIAQMCAEVDEAIEDGAEFIVLSDRDSNKDLAPIPSLLMLAAVHHHLIRNETRMKCGLVVEAGDVREVHHVATLIGYGASAVNPYLAMETVEYLVRAGYITGITPEKAVKNLIYALGKGVLKIMSKMGISTVSSYAGAQVFEAIGLSHEFVDKYFTGTETKLGGVALDVIAAENASRHAYAYPEDAAVRAHERLWTGGEYQWRRDGSPHLFNPETVFRLQHATRTRRYDIFREYTKLVDDQASQLKTLRGLFALRSGLRKPVPIDEVESVASIVKRFSTGAMSYGSISKEAHETLAIAMNRLGGKSNTGEGGEDVDRLLDPERRSAIKQVASGRFGVTSLYLTKADDIQIKLAQGAKPGEGGQLPPTKVYPWVARTRHATAGVGLISPPPHHDIYSIEDLKQLIYDLKRANPHARVHAKLVSQSGIGAVAAGTAKALADVILVSGHDGGTGASPLNSLKHAGTPWELGLAETQQTLMLNGMRDRVVVQVDGQLKTGRDVIIGALLGAEEFGFATAPLVVSGCIMMRVCHLDTCPVGVATQNPVLRQRFNGKPEFVINFMEFIAEEVREYLAELGFRSLDEAIGRHEFLDINGAVDHWKTSGLDLAPILTGPAFGEDQARRNMREQKHELEEHFDVPLIEAARDVIAHSGTITFDLPIRNTERAVGTMLGHHVTRRARRERDAVRVDRGQPDRLGRSVLRRVHAGRNHPSPRGRFERLRRQGTLGRSDRRPSAPRRDLRRVAERDRRQRHRLRRDPGHDVPARRGGGALLRAQLGGDGRRRGRGRPRARVHDGRTRGDPRRDRAQPRRRHVRRHRVHLPARQQARQPRGAGDRRTRARRARAPATPRSSATCSSSTRPRPTRLSRHPCWRTSTTSSRTSSASCRATTRPSC